MTHRLYIIAAVFALGAFAHLYGTTPRQFVARDSVDIAEQNFYFDSEGKLVFEQLIFIDADDSVVAWRLVRDSQPRMERDWKRGGYVALWNDQGTVREVRSQSVRTTHTQWDPEVSAREVLPKELRRGLSKPGRR